MENNSLFTMGFFGKEYRVAEILRIPLRREG
jgi:hypothetical protein